MLKITANNFRSFKELSYEITPPGLVAVEAMYDGTKERSNGAGKSSMLPEVLCWAIYGELTNDDKQVCSTDPGATEVRVEVQTPFASWVRRQQQDGTGNKIEINGIRKLSESKPELAKHFPPKQVFCSTMILGQGIGERFSNWTPGERAQTLSDLLQLSMWSTARKKLQGDRNKLAAETSRLEGMVSAYEQQLKQLTSAPQGDPKQYESAVALVSQLKTKVADLQLMLVQMNQKATQSAQQYGTVSSQRMQQQTMVNGYSSQLQHMGKKCPTCNRPYDKKHLETTKASILKAKQDAEVLLPGLDQQMSELDAQRKQDYEAAAKVQEQVQVVMRELEQANQQLASSQSFADQIADLRKTLATSQASLNNTKQSISGLDTLDRAFLEIPIRKIDGVLNVLNDRLVTVCNDIWESEFLVQLTSEKDLKKGGTKAEIGLVVKNRAWSYKGCSPGQQRKIDLTIQLALRELLVSAWPNALTLLICDDVVDVLDPWSKRKFYENFLLPAAETSAVFVLTPQDRYPIPMDRKILVGYTEAEGSRILQTTAEPVVVFG